MEVRLGHLIIRARGDLSHQEFGISLGKLVIELTLSDGLLEELVFGQLDQCLVGQQILVGLPDLFQLLMVRLVHFQVPGQDAFRDQTCSVMLILSCSCSLVLFEFPALECGRKSVVALAYDLPVLPYLRVFDVVDAVPVGHHRRVQARPHVPRVVVVLIVARHSRVSEATRFNNIAHFMLSLISI